MSHILSKRQKQIQAHRAIKKHIMTTFTSEVLNELERIVNDDETPISWFGLEDDRLESYIIKKYCNTWRELV